ncbi:MAG: citrate lyase subunit alpha, partial [Synergistaceae bacterium]|nr:citrate lyase subunit alpha [Synergistaceae bacterium]
FKGHDRRPPEGNRFGKRNRTAFNTRTDKTLPDIKAAISASGLKSGMTISFHHHLRNGDFVVNAVLDACAEMGIKDLVIFPTALFGVHKHLTKH